MSVASLNFYRILSDSGEVLAFSGNDEKNVVDMVSAITSNMWLIIQTAGEAALNEDNLNFLLIRCTVSIKAYFVLGTFFCFINSLNDFNLF